MTEHEQEAKPKTTYVVLELSGGRYWSKVGEHDASSPETAIRMAIANDASLDPGATFVATPKRSWRPMTLQRETKPIDRLVPYVEQTRLSSEPEPEPEATP